ncbi:MAG: hypothetical protein HYY40_10205 [Bacteroidetes bacterium]|nr:hypothetical protein [Bacteroidota bacterium]
MTKKSQRVKVPYALRYTGEALASRKGDNSNVISEVSGTANACTDPGRLRYGAGEQKLHTEAWLNACLPVGRD